MERLVFDILSALILLATALIGAFLPKHLEANGSMQPNSMTGLLFHLGNMLSAGVMLSAGFCHLLADSLRQLSFIGHFPIATFLAATGYILTLAADQVVQMVMERNGAGAGGGDSGQLADYRALEHCSPPAATPSPPGSPAAANGGAGLPRVRSPARGGGGGGGGGAHAAPGSARLHRLRSGGSGPPDDDGMHEVSLTSAVTAGLHALARSPTGMQHSPMAGGLSPRVGARCAGSHGKQQLQRTHTNGHCSLHDNPFEHVLELEMAVAPHNHFQVFLSSRRLSFATALLLAGALCIHSILEGMALGAQPTLRGTEDIFLAIVAHKGLAAYALGASIVESKASNAKFWTTIALFACATPIGILLGYVFAEHGGGGVGAALSALAAGTFIYVALMEVVPKELEDGSHRGKKMVAMLIGFGLMSLLAVWA